MVVPDWMTKEHDELRTEFQKLARDWWTAESERDAALARAEKAEREVLRCRIELQHVLALHKHKPSELRTRLTNFLADDKTPEPTKGEE